MASSQSMAYASSLPLVLSPSPPLLSSMLASLHGCSLARQRVGNGDRPIQLSHQQKPEETHTDRKVPGGTWRGNTGQRLHQIRTHSDRMGHGGKVDNGTDGTPTGQ